MSTSNNHTRILYNRYCHLLKPLTNLECATDDLFDKGILTPAERAEVLESADQKEALCQALTGKGISSLVEISKILTIQAGELKRLCEQELKRQNSKDKECSNHSDVVTTSSTTVTTSTESSASSSGSGWTEEGCDQCLGTGEDTGSAGASCLPPLRAGGNAGGV